MKQTVLFLMVSVFSVILLASCANENDPAYWLDRMDEKVYRENSIKKMQELCEKILKENGYNRDSEPVKKFLGVAVDGLIKAYDKYSNDMVAQEDIIKLLAVLGDPKAEQIFLKALEEEGAKQFISACNALRRFKVAKALSPLLAAHKKLVAARRARGTPNTPDENFKEHAMVLAMGDILVDNPDAPEKMEVIRTLIEVMETPDTEHELKINLSAMKRLGRIGDSSAIPALVRGIFFMGKRQKIGLGEIAFTALQQMKDPDAVVEGLVKMTKGEDTAFNQFIAKEKDVDARMPKQQGILLLGLLKHKNDVGKEYLLSEFNHDKPDEIDNKKAPENRPQFPPEDWVSFRRNWAAVALAQIGYDEIIPELKKRFVFKGNMIDTPPLEIPGYIDALYFLLDPEEAIPIFKKFGKVADDSLRMRAMLRLTQLGSFEDLAFATDVWKSAKKCPPPDVQPQCLKNDLKGYLARLEAAENCKDVDCWTGKLEHENWRVREKAVVMIGVLASKDESLRDKAANALVKRFEDQSGEVVTAAMMVIDRITPPPRGCPECMNPIKKVKTDLKKRGAAKKKLRNFDAFEGRVKARTRS